MRKITEKSASKLLSMLPMKQANTEVFVSGSKAKMFLHGNLIAEYSVVDGKKTLKITNAGWFSNTTKDRLNGLPGVHIQQKRGKWYLNGQEWDGSLTNIELV